MISFKAKTIKVGDYIPMSLITYKLSEIVNHPDLVTQLKAMTFDHRFTKPFTLTGWDIINFMRETNVVVTVGLYSQSYWQWKMTPVNAYKPASKHDEIFFNLRQVPRRPKVGPNSAEETLWHEAIHVVDHARPESFGHGDNKLKGKQNTATVKLADFMARIQL